MARVVEARVYEKADRNTWLKIVVTEGRQHLIKRLCAAIGHPVVRLFRPAHAGLSVKGLRPGAVRALSAEEVRRVKAVADGKASPEPELMLPARRHGRTSNSPEADIDEGGDEGHEPGSNDGDEAAQPGGALRALRDERLPTFTRGADRPRDREGSRSSPGGKRSGGFSRGEAKSGGDGRSRGFSQCGSRPGGRRRR
jgi:23S rRNA pseudouridine2605 synthase